MPVSDKDHLDALRMADNRRVDDLRAADQRAIELLATANAASLSRSQFNWMILISAASLIVAVVAIFWRHQ